MHQSVVTPSPSVRSPEEKYLELLKRCLTRSFDNSYGEIHPFIGSRKRLPFAVTRSLLGRFGLTLAKLHDQSPAIGPTVSTMGETMVGLPRLQNVQDCAMDVITSRVPGDFIEAGVWRGGVTILMKGILDVYGEKDRTVWVADSFEGLPKPDKDRYPADANDTFWMQDWMSVTQEDVTRYFAQYGLLDERVQFLKGWFKDTLPAAPIACLALLRIDGDMYESTMDVLRALYPKLSPGGYAIVDDYGSVAGCKAAVDDYRREHGITAEMTFVRDSQMGCVYWKKAS